MYRTTIHRVFSMIIIIILVTVMLMVNPMTIQFFSRPQKVLTSEIINPADLYGGIAMHENKDPPDSDKLLFENKPRRFRSIEPDQELLELEDEIRARNLIYNPHIQWLIEKASLCSDKNSLWAREQLKFIIEADRTQDMRTGDVLRPLAPSELLSQGDLHLLDQVDGTAWKVPMSALNRGMLVTGAQGGGKTRFLIWVCKQLNAADPPIPFFILDPKLELKSWIDYLGATFIDVEDISIDLSPPPGLTYEQFLTSLMPQIGEVIGVIYGVEILQQCKSLCIGLRERHLQNTGENTEISLNDIYQSIPFVTDVSRGRRLGYREAVSTGLSRILTGSGQLFSCRKGVDLQTLFQNNIILGCRSITDEFAAKYLALHLLYWLYESERYSQPTDRVKRALILDDATLFLQAKPGFDAASKTSSFTHIFSRLRSSGNAVIATTQIPHLADAGILALSHTILCIGGLHYGEDTKLLAQMMSLDDHQRDAITQLSKREAIGICAHSAYPGVVHGNTVEIPDVSGADNDG
jgi:hypothetical protein